MKRHMVSCLGVVVLSWLAGCDGGPCAEAPTRRGVPAADRADREVRRVPHVRARRTAREAPRGERPAGEPAAVVDPDVVVAGRVVDKLATPSGGPADRAEAGAGDAVGSRADAPAADAEPPVAEGAPLADLVPNVGPLADPAAPASPPADLDEFGDAMRAAGSLGAVAEPASALMQLGNGMVQMAELMHALAGWGAPSPARPAVPPTEERKK